MAAVWKKTRCKIGYLFYHVICSSSFLNVCVESCVQLQTSAEVMLIEPQSNKKMYFFSCAVLSFSSTFSSFPSLWELCRADLPSMVCSEDPQPSPSTGSWLCCPYAVTFTCQGCISCILLSTGVKELSCARNCWNF